MLRTMEHISGSGIHAKDGDIGRVDEFYFDDEKWVVRYLVADTGPWIFGRKVLISPFSVQSVEWEGKKVLLNLTKEQVRNSPDIDVEKPISRIQETEYSRYYGIPFYWGGTGLWGNGAYPMGMPVGPVPEEIRTEEEKEAIKNVHLKSSREVIGYGIHASDGNLGHVDDFLFEDESWAIRYVVVDTKNFLPGKKVIISPRLVGGIEWAESALYLNLTKEQIKNAPEYNADLPIGRDYEERLHDYYGWEDRYWL